MTKGQFKIQKISDVGTDNPIVAGLTPGKITLRDVAGKITNFTFKSNGFLEFSGNKATLMLDSLELPA